jgi:hypothetical protein
MADGFRKILPKEPVEPRETREISPLSSPPELEPETVSSADLSSRRPFVNDCLNSRIATEIPAGRWRARCSTELLPGTRPKHILQDSDRIIIQGDGPWQLFDKDCRLLSRGYLVSSDVVLDAENKLFYFTDSTGMIEARNLSDGSHAFSISLIFGRRYRRSFIARRHNQMVVVSVERVVDQDAEREPQVSTIEVLEFSEPNKVDENGRLTSSQGTAELRRNTLTLLAARQDETIVAVTDNQICLIDLTLQIRAAFNDSFTPLSISLSSTGLIYLLVIKETVFELWLVTPNGERVYSSKLPEGVDFALYPNPPIVSYDHQAFLIADNRLMAFNRAGECLWEYKTRSRIGGAVVTGDNRLLLAAGSEIGAFDSKGQYETLYEFKDELLQTPPALNAFGELLVASDKKLYCLTIQES